MDRMDKMDRTGQRGQSAPTLMPRLLFQLSIFNFQLSISSEGAECTHSYASDFKGSAWAVLTPVRPPTQAPRRRDKFQAYKAASASWCPF